MKNKLILASASPRRLELLKQIGITPDQIIPADIDETPLKKEHADALAKRLATQKALHIQEQVQDQIDEPAYVLAADTVVACGPQILDKTSDEEQARAFLQKLSGRRHHVFGGICLIDSQGKQSVRCVKTLVQLKRLTDQEIDIYIESKEWDGKAGGYGIQGLAAGFIKHLSGSYSNVVGLSLYDTLQMLNGLGYKPSSGD